MRRLFCILSSFSLVLFIFSLSPDVHAVVGFKTELIKSHTSRTYGRSSSTESVPNKSDQAGQDSDSNDAKPDDKKPDDDTDGGNAQSKLKDPIDDEEDAEIVTLTITPLTSPVSSAPAQLTTLNSIENVIVGSMAGLAPLSVQQQDDQGHVSFNGNLALWLSDFLHGNENPVEALNNDRGMLFIPEFFAENFATYINSLPAQESGGILVHIDFNIITGAASPSINQPMTIHYFINIDDQVQMSLYMDHINAITGQTVIATAIFSDDIDTSDPLDSQRKSGLVRVDSLTHAEVVLGGMQNMKLGSDTDGGHMPSIAEGSGEGPQDNVVVVFGFNVLNTTAAEQLINIKYRSKIPFEYDELTLNLDSYHESDKIME